MATLIITEKASQAKDLRAALGARFGQILPAEGHLLRLAEPEEVHTAWKSWSCVVLKPDGLYPTRPAAGGNKPAKLKAIAAALKSCDDVILATDCDREGQLIGQEILDHLGYRGRVRRALFRCPRRNPLHRPRALMPKQLFARKRLPTKWSLTRETSHGRRR
jgi:DNA topoisomerase III